MSDKNKSTHANRVRVEQVPLTDLKPDPRNTRTHSGRQIQQIADSIKAFGFVNPILIDEADRIIAGHARRDAAKQLELETVPVIRLSHLTEHEKRALAIADNRLPENAGWNEELLAQEFKILSEVEVDFDLTVTGFTQAEIDLRIESLAPVDDPTADEIPEPEPQEEIVVRRGDLFHLGSHRLLCGDATSSADFEVLMDGQIAEMAITDPPFNLKIPGHVSGLGRTKHDNFIQGSGEMTEEQFTAFLKQALSNLAAFSIDGAIHYIHMDWRHMREILTAGDTAYSELKQVIVWVKDNSGLGTFYRSQHELIFVFKSGTANHINNFELGQHGRHRSNVWRYPGTNSFGKDRSFYLELHPTTKPVALVSDAVKDCSKRRGIIVDPFLGSGTSVIAAQKTGRRAYAMELDPKYVQTAIRRWEAFTGEDAVHVASGLTFHELRETRARNAESTKGGPNPNAARPDPKEVRHAE